jgi:hypothetical protein
VAVDSEVGRGTTFRIYLHQTLVRHIRKVLDAEEQ